MGDATSGQVRLSFNPQLRVEFRGATVTSDAGLLLPRELDERLGLSALIERHVSLRASACRKLLDGTPLSADSRAHRAARGASDVIGRTAQAGSRIGAVRSVAAEGDQCLEEARS
jgi:hypothetical protein